MEQHSDCHIRQGLQSTVFRLADDSTKLMQHQIHNTQHVRVCVCVWVCAEVHLHTDMHPCICTHMYMLIGLGLFATGCCSML